MSIELWDILYSAIRQQVNFTGCVLLGVKCATFTRGHNLKFTLTFPRGLVTFCGEYNRQGYIPEQSLSKP